MLDKFKQLQQLKALQDSLVEERAEVERMGTKVVVNGKMEIEQIQLNPDLSREDQEKVLRECLNEAMKKVQMLVARKMSQMPGIGI